MILINDGGAMPISFIIGISKSLLLFHPQSKAHNSNSSSYRDHFRMRDNQCQNFESVWLFHLVVTLLEKLLLCMSCMFMYFSYLVKTQADFLIIYYLIFQKCQNILIRSQFHLIWKNLENKLMMKEIRETVYINLRFPARSYHIKS